MRFLVRMTWVAVAGAVLVGAGTAPLAAQGITTAAVRGRVVDDAGQPVESASITLTNVSTGQRFLGSSRDRGLYSIENVAVGGPYRLEARAVGFQPITQGGIVLRLGQAVELELIMGRAVALAAIEVTAEQMNPVLSRAHTGTASTIAQDEIANFPTIGRGFTDFATLSPAVTLVEGAPSIAGQNNRFNNIQIDGAVNNDVFGLADSGIPGGQVNAKAISLEAIQEFQVLTAPFDVRHGRFSGGVINAVTKSGTNTWQGSLFSFHTNENLVSDLDDVAFDNFNDTQFGFTLGGPIQRDKIHLFFAAEFEIQNAPNPGGGLTPGAAVDQTAIDLAVHPDSIQSLINVLNTVYGIDPGSSEALSLDNPRTNIFGRLDFSLSDRHRLLLRHNYSRAAADRSVSRGRDFAFSSNGQDFTSFTNSTVAQLFSRIGERWNNDLLINVEFVRDSRLPLVPFPQVEVDNDSDLGGVTVGQTLIFGAEEFSQANSLDQDVVQVTDNLTGAFGDHIVTIGTSNEYFKFDNVFFSQSIGLYEFDSIDDLRTGSVADYEINTLVAPLTDPAAKFKVLSLGGYVQDQWSVNQHLNVTLGFRVDFPIMLDDPRDNPAFQTAFGFSTSTIPSGNPLWQPRLGFNWASNAAYQTLVRGGVGLFAGRPPFVWMSNAYGNTGSEFVRLGCSGGNAPPLDLANYPDSPPMACNDGTTAGAAGVTVVNIFDEDFKFPLDLKIALGVDRELPAGFTITLEGLYTKSVEQIFLEEFNLAGIQGTDPTQGDRVLFGTPTASGFAPVRKDASFAHVVRGINTSDNRSWLFTAELQRRFSDGFRVRGSYTYSDVEDTQSQFSSQATSNVGRAPIPGDLNNPPRTTSAFERPHKIVLSATGRFDLGNGFALAITPQYFGQSGNPYSYGVEGDINGDGYRSGSPRISRDNDLVYVPNDVSEIAFADPADAALFEALIQAEPCLSESRGRILERNSCRNPWNNRFDVRIAVDIPAGPGNVQLIADIINVFANKLERTSNVDRAFEALDLQGRVGGVSTGALEFDYTGPRADLLTGEIDPFTTFSPASQRRIQAGVRYNF